MSMGLMALAHLCSGISCTALYLLLYLRGNSGTRDFSTHRWSYGGLMCSAHHFMMSFDQIVSSLTLTITCVERYLKFFVPFTHRWVFARGNWSIIFWGVLMVSGSFSAPHLLSTSSYATLEVREQSMKVCPLASKHGIIWAMDFGNFCVFLMAPLTVMAVLYFKQYKLLWRFDLPLKLALRARSSADDDDLSSDLSVPGQDDCSSKADDANPTRRVRFALPPSRSCCDLETGLNEHISVVHWKKRSPSPKPSDLALKDIMEGRANSNKYNENLPCCGKSLPPIPPVDTIIEAAEDAEILRTVHISQPQEEQLHKSLSVRSGQSTHRESISLAKTKALKSHQTSFKILIFITTIFGICNLPFQILKIWAHYFAEDDFGGDVTSVVAPLVFMIAIYVNAGTHPIMYVLMSKYWWEEE